MKIFLRVLLSTVLFLFPFSMFPSDRSDATDLMNQCDKTAKVLEVAIRNFGNKDEIASFENGLNVIKLGKVKLAQSKFLEAKAKFEEYQKIEYDLYGSMSPRYMQKSQEIIDKISEDLVDFVTQSDVLKNFTDSDQNLTKAKASYNSKNYNAVILSCRLSKYLVINCYVLAKKAIPKEYKKDLEDYYNRIYQE
jgi:hypothetical protein